MLFLLFFAFLLFCFSDQRSFPPAVRGQLLRLGLGSHWLVTTRPCAGFHHPETSNDFFWGFMGELRGFWGRFQMVTWMGLNRIFDRSLMGYVYNCVYIYNILHERIFGDIWWLLDWRCYLVCLDILIFGITIILNTPQKPWFSRGWHHIFGIIFWGVWFGDGITKMPRRMGININKPWLRFYRILGYQRVLPTQIGL